MAPIHALLTSGRFARLAFLLLAFTAPAMAASLSLTNDPSTGEQAKQIRWDDDAQHLIIDKWVSPAERLTAKIAPMTEPAPMPKHP